MALDVRLVDDVHADLVAQVEEGRVVRVVRTPHGGDVVSPHREQVVAHVVDRDRLAAGRMMIVAVDAEHPDRLAVHEELAVADLHRAEADELGVDLGHGAVGIEQFGGHAVPRRRFGRPRIDPGELERHGGDVAAKQVGRREPVRNGDGPGTTDAPTAQGLDREADLPSRTGCDETAQRGARHERAGPLGRARTAQARVADQRGEVHRTSRLDVHRPVQAGHPPLILVLDVAVGAPPRDHDRNVVGAGVDERRDVVLAGESAVGAVPDELAVDVEHVCALGTADVQHDLAIEPSLGDLHRAAVHAGGVAVGQTGRRTRKRHLHIRVLGQVADALQRPVAGHGNRRPRPARRRPLDGRCRDGVGAVEQSEPPATVE